MTAPGALEFQSFEEAIRYEYRQRVSGVANAILQAMIGMGALREMASAIREEEREADDKSKAGMRAMVERSIIMAKYHCELVEDVAPPAKVIAAARAHDEAAARRAAEGIAAARAYDEAAAQRAVAGEPRGVDGLQSADRAERIYVCAYCGEPTSMPPRIARTSRGQGKAESIDYVPACCSRLSCIDKARSVPVEDCDPAEIVAAMAGLSELPPPAVD